MKVYRQLKTKLSSGDLILTMCLQQARTPDIPMIAAKSGLDAVYVDLEHSCASIETAKVLCVAALMAGIAALVRVPSLETGDAGRLLDGGAAGLLLPHISNRAQAEKSVRTCKFPPLGERSFGGPNISTGYGSVAQKEALQALNESTALVAMIETPEGVSNAAEIAAVEGIDVLLVGTNDLCLELGIPGQLRHPTVRESYGKVAEACRTHDKCFGVGGIRNDPEYFAELIATGARFLIIGSDAGYIALGSQRDVEAIRAFG
jgi:2-keto-3-deoxy-L-rhamnonate aldolase RhmA